MLNSPQAVKEILDKQSKVTSSRPPLPVVSDALSGGMRFLFMPYGPEWRRLRTVSHRLLMPRMSDTFQPSQEFEAKQLLYDLLTGNYHNTEFYMHIRRYTVSVLMTSTYGKRRRLQIPRGTKLIYHK
jgi:cytochrome P450